MGKQLDTGLAAPKAIKKVEELADKLDEVRRKRMALTTKEVEAQDELIAEMHKHKITTYKYDDKVVTIEGKEKVKVKTEKDEVQSTDNE